tara:strand:+ start:1127 stop:1438 length:312 start_codon:yes stop_codon:yes gene_type:complete
MYYILTSKKKQKILATKDYTQCFDFITKNFDAKIKSMDISAKPITIDKRTFLKLYLKNTEDQNKFFLLSEILISGNNNLSAFLNPMKLMGKYRTFKKVYNNSL